MSTFTSLPTELLVAVFERLDALSLLSVSATCRLCNELSKTPSLSYIVLCFKYGVVDGVPDDQWPVHRRIEALSSYYARFSTLRWSKSYCFPRFAWNLYELFGGVYGQSRTGSTEIDLRQTMCVTTSEDEQSWTVATGVRIRDFGMDPFQDLLVIVRHHDDPRYLSREIHLRSLTTGDAHPLAQRHVLEASAAESSRRDSCWIQVSNDILGILFYNASSYNSDMELESNDLVIWNWKAGTMQFMLRSTRNQLLDCFCFLSSTHVLVAWRGLIHGDTSELQERSYLEVFDIANRSAPVKRFLLPRMNPGGAVWSFNICCEPVPTPSSHKRRPFYTSPDHRLCVVAVRFLYMMEGLVLEQDPINFIFFTSSLLRSYPPSITQINKLGSPDVQVIPWTLWNDQTRVTLWEPTTQNWTLNVCGSRIVRRTPGKARNTWKIQIAEFNPYASIPIPATTTLFEPPHTIQESKGPFLGLTRQGSMQASEAQYEHKGPESVENNRLFQEPIVSNLPYLEIETRKSFKLNSLMMDHDNIYLVREKEIEVLAF